DMRFHRVAAVVFTVIALAHAWRAVQQIPVQVGATAVPVSVSIVGAVGAALLALWGFRARG
ncbi:MAG: hypothetical protein ABIV06_01535, partial [Thermoanaerobaculia bacterium]